MALPHLEAHSAGPNGITVGSEYGEVLEYEFKFACIR
jgi:hypothetical protein